VSKIKILQVNKLYFPWIGGVEKVAQDISEGLREKAEVSVLVCQPRGKGKEEICNGIRVSRAGSLGMLSSMPISFSFINKFRQLSKNSDIVQFHFPFPLGDLAYLLSGYKGKIVIWWHCEIIKQKKVMFLYRPIMKRFLKRADLILTSTKENIENSKYLQEFKNKCKVIPFGIDIKKYEESPKASILTEALNDKKNLKVLFVGRLIYYKGLDILIDAFSSVNKAKCNSIDMYSG
jgi:rhamnosyl/mannosyltransferase